MALGSSRLRPDRCLTTPLSWLTNCGPLLPVTLLEAEGLGRHAVMHHDHQDILVMLGSSHHCVQVESEEVFRRNSPGLHQHCDVGSVVGACQRFVNSEACIGAMKLSTHLHVQVLGTKLERSTTRVDPLGGVHNHKCRANPSVSCNGL